MSSMFSLKQAIIGSGAFLAGMSYFLLKSEVEESTEYAEEHLLPYSLIKSQVLAWLRKHDASDPRYYRNGTDEVERYGWGIHQLDSKGLENKGDSKSDSIQASTLPDSNVNNTTSQVHNAPSPVALPSAYEPSHSFSIMEQQRASEKVQVSLLVPYLQRMHLLTGVSIFDTLSSPSVLCKTLRFQSADKVSKDLNKAKHNDDKSAKTSNSPPTLLAQAQAIVAKQVLVFNSEEVENLSSKLEKLPEVESIGHFLSNSKGRFYEDGDDCIPREELLRFNDKETILVGDELTAKKSVSSKATLGKLGLKKGQKKVSDHLEIHFPEAQD